MPVVIVIMVTGSITKLTEEDVMSSIMDLYMLVSGKKINNINTVFKPGQMLQHTKETTKMVKKKAWELSNGQMGPYLSENLKIIRFMVKECISGLMVVRIQVNGI